MKFLKYALFTFIALFCIGRSQAQCNINYSLGYYVYTDTTEVEYGAGNHGMFTTVTSNGAASMALGAGNCPDSMRTQVQNSINSATHYLQVFNQLVGPQGPVGSWQVGDTLCASCWLTAQNQVGYLAQPGVQFSWNYGVNVVCSVGGLMSFFNTLHLYTELAFTEGKAIGAPTCVGILGKVCTQKIIPWCTAQTSPPDFYPTKVIYGSTAPLGNNGYTLGFAICNRSSVSGRWGCPLPGAPPVGTFEPDPLSKILTGTYPLQPCTHNP